MLSRSAEFDRAVRGTAKAAAKVDVYRAGARLLEAVPLDANGTNEISLDLTAEARRRISVTVIDEQRQWSRDPNGPLTPYGSELAVGAGFEWPSGEQSLLAQGVFRITSVRRRRNGQTIIDGIDRSEPIAASGYETPMSIPAGTNRATAILDIVAPRLPGVSYEFATTDNLPAAVLYEEGRRSGTPWRNAIDLAAGGGMDLYWTEMGALRLAHRPDPYSYPVWEYSPGPENIDLDLEEVLDLEGVRNVWVVEGQAADDSPPLRASAEITDTRSAIHPYRIGRRPEFYATPLASTLGAVQAEANYYKLIEGGRSEGFTVTAKPHPAQTPGDVVSIVDDDLGINITAVMASWSFDLFQRKPAVIQMLGRKVA